MKKVIALVCVLCLLLSGCAPAQQVGPVDPVNEPEGITFSDNTLLRKENVDTMLIGAVGYDSDGYSLITSLTVLVREDGGDVTMLTIPKDTRVWVEHYHADGSFAYSNYGSIGDVYHAAESAGLGSEKTVEAVSQLLGGVRIDGYALLNTVQLEYLTDLTDSIYVMVKDPISEHQIINGFQDISPKIAGYASYSYLTNIGGVDYSGTDIYKLNRHQQLTTVFMQTLASQMSGKTGDEKVEFAQSIINCLTTGLSTDDVLNWLSGDTVTFGKETLLEGVQNDSESTSYWIADAAQLKSWVLEYFYNMEDD